MRNLIKITLLLVFLGMRLSMRSRHLGMNRWAYWHSAIASGFHVIVAAYLLWFGVIGLMTWAWDTGIIDPQPHMNHQFNLLKIR